MKATSCTQNWIRKSFLTSFSTFLFVRLLCLGCPLPFHFTTMLLVSDQLPRYLIFVGFQTLGLWLGTAILSNFAKNRISRSWIVTSFLALFFLLLVAIIVLVFVGIVCSFVSFLVHFFLFLLPQDSHWIRIIDICNFSIILISLSVYGVRLLQIYISLRHRLPFKNRLLALVFLSLGIFCIFLARLVHTILFFIGCSPFANLVETFSENVFEDKGKPFVRVF